MDKWFIVDAHNQFMPPESLDEGGQAVGGNVPGSPGSITLRTLISDIDTRLRVMDEAGVDMAVIHQAPRSGRGLEMCRLLNEGNARAVREHPGRLIPCAHLPLDGGGSPEALEELDRAVTGLGMKALALETSMESTTLDSEQLFPLWEKVSRLDIPVVIHPTMRQPIWGGIRYEFSSGISREYEITKAGFEVMYGVLGRFPDLKVLIPHHGGAMPIWKGRMLMSFLPEGQKLPDSMRGVPRTPRVRREMGIDRAFDALFNRLYFDTAGFQGWMPITLATLNVASADRVLFGTDYPFEVHESQDIKAFIDNIKGLDLPEADRRNILGENARRLFKVD